MSLDWRTVAHYFIAVANVSGDFMTNLRLQKLVYYAQSWHLAFYGKPLFQGTFEAWVHGPVLPPLYQEYRSLGSSPIREPNFDEDWLDEFRQSLEEPTRELLDSVVETYMVFTPYELERMTHREKPWIEARRGLSPDMPSHFLLNEETMQGYYRQLMDEQNGQEPNG